MAVRMVWKYIIGRAKTMVKNYNVIERAEKVMDGEKRVAPRHPESEEKLESLIKGYKDLQHEIEKKPVDLLNRLKVVKVSSNEVMEGEKKDARALPQLREPSQTPIFGYEEPTIIPEGKCSLRQALEFITNHQNNPDAHSFELIARSYKIKSEDVKNVVENFRAFELHISRDDKTAIAKSNLEALGANKVVKALYRSKFSEKNSESISNTEGNK